MLLSDVWLTCLSRTSRITWEQRGLGRPIGIQVAHVTRESDTTFKVKRSPGRFTHRGVYAQAAVAVSVRSYWAWETAATLPPAGTAVGSAARGAHTGRRGAGAYRVATRTACYEIRSCHCVNILMTERMNQRMNEWALSTPSVSRSRVSGMMVMVTTSWHQFFRWRR